MKGNVNVPEIRFKGFSAEWEQCKLIDNAKEILDYRGKSPEKFGMNWTDEGYLVLSSLNVKDGYIDKNIEAKYADQSLFEYWMKDNKLEKGDVLFTTEAPLGNVAQIPDNEGYVLNQRVVAFKTDNTKTNNNFLANLLKSPLVQSKLNAKSTGGTAKGIGMKEFSKISSLIPIEVSEQTKIGNLFYSLDHLITLHQNKLKNLEQTKKGLLQKMFPKNNEVIPDLRFSNFTNEWEQCKLGNVAEIVGGGTPSTNVPEYWGGDIDWYSPVEIGDQIYVNDSQKKITELGLKKSSAKILPIGTVLFTSRAGIGNTAILAKEGSTNQGFQSIIPLKDKLNTYFIFSRSNELRKYGETNGAGSTFVEVSGKQMQKMPILIPNIKEQQKIGSFFQSLDHLITLHQNKLDELDKIKSGLLQKMFV